MKNARIFCLAMGVLCVALGAQLAEAATISEYFNGYGDTRVDLIGCGNAGSGWNEAWVLHRDSTGGVSLPGYLPDYRPGENLMFTNAGYSNAGNQSGSDDGAAGLDYLDSSDGNAGDMSKRLLDPGLTGTVWVSMLVRFDHDAHSVLLHFDADSPNNVYDFVGIRQSSSDPVVNGDAVIRWENSNDTSSTIVYGPGTTYLFLVKAEVNYSGSLDRISFWIKQESDSLADEAALGPAIYVKSNKDCLGPTFDAVGLSFQDNTVDGGNDEVYADAIRISNDTDAFQRVMGVANPGTLTGDINADGDVNLVDFALFSSHWQEETPCEDYNDWCGWSDFDRSGTVDVSDLSILAQYWLE